MWWKIINRYTNAKNDNSKGKSKLVFKLFIANAYLSFRKELILFLDTVPRQLVLPSLPACGYHWY